MSAPSDVADTSSEIGLHIARDTLEQVLTEALTEARGRERELLAERFDDAISALIRLRRDARAVESVEVSQAELWRRAQQVVRVVATTLRDSQLEAVRALAPRVSAVEEGIREAQGEASAMFDPGRKESGPAPAFSASHGVAALHHLPPRRPASKLKAPPRAARSIEGLAGTIAGLQQSLLAMAGRLLSDGEGAIDELDDMFAAIAPDDEPEADGAIVTLRTPPITEDTVGTRGHEAMLKRAARSIMEDIGAAGMLRMPRADEPITPQARRFDERVLAGLDALAALASDGRVTIDVVDEVVTWARAASVSDGFRPFVRALVLSCLDGDGCAEAAVLALRASPPETWAAQCPGLMLGSSPRVDGALAQALAGDSAVGLLPHLLDTLAARRTLALADVLPFLHHADAAVRKRAASGLCVAASPDEAERLLRDFLEREVDDEVIADALEALTVANRATGRHELRRRLDEDAERDGVLGHATRHRLLEMLAIVGDASDVERLTGGIERHPRDAGAVGWHGSALLVEPLLACLESADPRAQSGAARSLHRITGAALAAPDDPDARREPDPYRPIVFVERWRAWWGAERDGYEAGRRYRLGKAFHLRTTIDEIVGLGLPASVLRLGLYELAVATGRPLPDHRMWVAAIVSAAEALRAEVESMPAGAWLPARAAATVKAQPRAR